jgi:RHS repeat-associated protein
MHVGGLQYLRARWYDPAAGTFLGRDPFEGFDTMPYSLHYYQYGYSDPVRFTDPSGQNPGFCFLTGPGIGVCLTGYGIFVGAVLLAGGVSIIVTSILEQDRNSTAFTYQPVIDPSLHEHEGFSQEQLEPYIESYPLSEGVCVEPEYYPWVEMVGVEIEHMPTNEAQDLLLDWALLSSTTLDRNLGGTRGDHLQAHHLIPEQFRQHRFVRRAVRAGWDHDQAYNGILLPDNLTLSRRMNLPKHNGSHGPYNNRVEPYLDDFESMAQSQGWSDQKAYDELLQLASNMRNYVRGLGGGGKVQ